MARYRGPVGKISRRLGIGITDKGQRVLNKRSFPPGQHGPSARRRQVSDYGLQLLEKQKLRLNYGLTERQFRRLYKEAVASRDPSGDKLLEFLERRLDNFVFRAGFAPTAVAARQLVRHKHVLLNGRAVNIPSIRIRPGDRIQLGERARRIPVVVEALAEPALTRPEWLVFDEAAFVATMTRTPSPDEVPFPVDVQQVVEYYAVRL